MARSISAALQTALDTRATTLCLCWKAVRQDGNTYGFTDHDTDLTFGGVTYKATTSFVGSAIQDQLGLAVSNADIMGAIFSDAVTDADLEDGRWDYASVTIYAVDWKSLENVVLLTGNIGQVQHGDLAFQAEMRSLGQHFAQYIGSLCQPKCRSNFGDTSKGLDGGCNFTLPAVTTGTIATASNRTSFKVTAAGSFPDGTKGSLAGGYFDFGYAKATSGANSGVSREIASSDSSLNITVIEPFPEDFAVGDSMELQIGCDKTPETCRTNYSNLANFRGEPYVPGTDEVMRVHNED